VSDPNEPLAHEEAIGMLDDLAEGELDEQEAARVRAHLATCEKCQAVQAALGGGIRAAVASTPAVQEKSPDLLPGVQRRLRLRSKGRFYGETARKSPSPWPLLVASIAVLVGLTIAYFMVGQMGGASAPSAPTANGSVR